MDAKTANKFSTFYKQKNIKKEIEKIEKLIRAASLQGDFEIKVYALCYPQIIDHFEKLGYTITEVTNDQTKEFFNNTIHTISWENLK